jgi:glycosyltransferase involved in cell wall biosynthesis
MERTGLEACDRIVAVSRAMKEDLQSAYSIPSERISVIHNGIDHQRYRPVHGPETLRLLGVRKPYILFVGRLTKAKGIVDLLEASRHLPRRLQVVCVTGRPDAPGSEEAMTRAVAASPNVLWIPRMLSEEETIHLYTDCEAFVCPSIYEPFGITNLEAMACGRPVVATRVGGIPEVVLDGETGLLVPPSNPGALAEAIEGLLADPERAGAMGVAGRRRVEEHFGWHSVALRTLQLYREVLAGSDLSIDPRPQAE